MQSDLNLQASELTVNECTLYIVYAFPGNQPMTLVLLAHVLAAMQQSYKKPTKFSTLTFSSVCMSNMPAREIILQANVYQEILV